jgi:hypothetical protein
MNRTLTQKIDVAVMRNGRNQLTPLTFLKRPG